jgi:hypothetical protein
VTKKIQIAWPKPQPPQTGVKSTGVNGESLRTRINNMDKEEVERAARKCGLSVSAFSRWVLVRAAKEINDV